MENDYQKNKYGNDESSSLNETNSHSQPRGALFISVLLILLSLSLIGSTCYYVWGKWKKQLNDRDKNEYLLQQEKAKLERKIQELEIALQNEKNISRSLREEIDLSKQFLAKEFIQNERDKGKLEDEKQKLEGAIQNLEITIQDEKNKSRSLHDEIDRSKQNLANERTQNEREKALLRNQNVYYFDDDDYFYYRRYRNHRYRERKKRHVRVYR